MGAFDDLIPGQKDKPAGAFDDLIPKAADPAINLDAPVGGEGFIGGLAGAGRQFAKGIISDIPKALGQGMDFFANRPTEIGKTLQGVAEQTDKATPGLNESIIGQRDAQDPWSIRGAAEPAGRSAALSFGLPLAGAGVGAAIGSVVPVIGTLAGAGAGFIGGSLAALPMMAGQQGYETQKRVKEAQLKAGKSPEEAEAAGREAGWINAGVEGGGELLGDVFPIAKIAKPFMALAKPAAGVAVRSLFGGGIKKAAGTVAGTEIGEIATEIGQQTAQAEVEGRYGAGEGATWKDTASVIMPTALMSLLPGGFAAAHNFRHTSQIKAALEAGDADPERRAAAASTVFTQLKDANPQTAEAFSLYARDQILAGKPIEIADDQFYADWVTAKNAPPAPAPLALPAPQDTDPRTYDARSYNVPEPMGGEGSAGPISTLQARQTAEAQAHADAVYAARDAFEQAQGIRQELVQEDAQRAADRAFLTKTINEQVAADELAAEERAASIALARQAALPSAQMGLNPAAGPISALAANAVDSGLTGMQTAQRAGPIAQMETETRQANDVAAAKEAEKAPPKAATAPAAQAPATQAPTGGYRKAQQAPATLFPFPTPEAAQKRAAALTQGTGEQHVAVPHPYQHDKYTVVPQAAEGATMARQDGRAVERAEPAQSAPVTAADAAARTHVATELQKIKDWYLVRDIKDLAQAYEDGGNPDLIADDEDESNDDKFFHGANIRGSLNRVRDEAAEIQRLATEFPAEFAAGIERMELYGDKSRHPEAIRRNMAFATDSDESRFAAPRNTPPVADNSAATAAPTPERAALAVNNDLQQQYLEALSAGDDARADEIAAKIDAANGKKPATIDTAAHKAATSPQNDLPEPTDAQKEAGNYQKGHHTIGGVPVSIENPQGSKRRPEWPTMKYHYGYIPGVIGKDKDHLDVFIKPGTPDDYDGPVFIVDQIDPKTGKFDEHKIIIGDNKTQDAEYAYLDHYERGWKGLGDIKRVEWAGFQRWLKEGNTKAPFAPQHGTPAALPPVKAEPNPYKPAAGDNPVTTTIDVDEEAIPLTMGVEDFNEITDEWAALFAPPGDERVIMSQKVAGQELLTPEQAKAQIDEWKAHAAKQGETTANANRWVISLFDWTGEWAKPWAEAGYNVIYLDIKDGVDINDLSVEWFSDNYPELTDVWAILAAPPCTDFANSGNRHKKAKMEDGRTAASIELVRQTLRTIEYFRPALWALENPVGEIAKMTGLPPARLSFDPNHFGNPYTKKTLIWGQFNGDLPAAPVEPTEGSKMHKKFGGKSEKTKEARSETPEGFAYAFFMANNAVDMPAEERLTRLYPMASGAIKTALKAGVPAAEAEEILDHHYDYDDGGTSREALAKAVAKLKAPGLAKIQEAKSEREATTGRDDPLFEQAKEKFANYAPGANIPDVEARIESLIGPRPSGNTVAWQHRMNELQRALFDAKVFQHGIGGRIEKFGAAPPTARGKGESITPEPGFIPPALAAIVNGKPPRMDATADERLVLIACAAEKGATRAPAIDLYKGALFDVLRKWMPEQAPGVAILSAKHGLVFGHEELDPYDQKLTPERADELIAQGLPEGIEFDKEMKDVFIAGSAEYQRVMRSFVAEMMKAGMIAKDASINATSGGIGTQRGQLGDYLKTIAAEEKAPEAVKAADVADVSADEFDALINEVQAERAEKWKPIGNNDIQETIYEGPNGERSVMRGTARILEPKSSATAGEKRLPTFVPIAAKPAGLAKMQAAKKANEAKRGPKVTPQVPPIAGTAPLGVKPLKQAAQQAAEGIKEGFAGLDALFGRKGTLGSGPSFDEETWAKAKPHFEAAFNEFVAAGKSLKEFVRHILDVYNETVIPYLKRWHQEKAKGASNEQNGDGVPGPQALDQVASGEGGAAQGGQQAERGDPGRGDGGEPGDRGSDGAGVSAARGRGGRAAHVHPAQAGARGQRGTVGKGGAGRAGKSAPQDNGSVRGVAPPNIPAQNFRITSEVRLGQGGEAEKFADNLAAIRTLKAIEAENRRATPDEQRILARYVGWGGLANAFADESNGEFKPGWQERGQALAELLTPAEMRRARRSTQNAHFTSETIVNGMWSIADRLGFKGGIAFESSMGPGNFLGLIPEALAGATKFIGVELDSITARIGKLLYPQSTVLNIGYHKLPMADNSVDLNIGNPPFGNASLRFQYKPELQGKSIHNQFFIAGIDAVKPGGLQINVVSRYLLDAKDPAARIELAKRARLLGAIRLPQTAFKENARTDVVTDIVVLQKLTESEQARMAAAFKAESAKPEKDYQKERERRALIAEIPEWVQVREIRDPLGGDPMPVNAYFKHHPEMILGTMDRSGTHQQRNDITVHVPKGADLGAMLAEAIDRLPRDVMDQSADAIAASAERYKTLGEALKIAVDGHEPGALFTDEDGKLQQVFERETPEGAYELARRELVPTSPWSDTLMQNREGKWYRLVQKFDDKGAPLKFVKNGKPTKRNVYEQEIFKSDADVPPGLLLGSTNHAILRELVSLRDLLMTQLKYEADDVATKDIEANRKKLAAAYKSFVAKHGYVSRYGKLVSSMPDNGRILALEVEYYPAISAEKAVKTGQKERPESAVPAPIMQKRVLHKYEPPAKAQSPADALVINLAESGRIDLARIASLLGITQEEAIKALHDDLESPLIFKDPEKKAWVARDEYLSGQVRRKLEAAKGAALTKNVEALTAIQPEPWGAENVTVNLGASWVPPAVYGEFITHLTGESAIVRFAPMTNSYAVQGNSDTPKGREWGTSRMPATTLISDILNSTAIKVYDVDSDGARHVNQDETALALLKAKEIRSAFSEWVFDDGDRRRSLVAMFNDKYNTIVNRQHDGSHLKLPGKVPDQIIKMRKHQLNAIWRGISERFMLADHAVGSGKTFTSIARAMERRRMGLSRKPLIVVPNHMVEQFAQDVYRLYPGAKVLAAGKKDFERQRRRRLFGKIATGDWDVIVMPHSSFGFIGIAPETEERFLDAELAIATQAVEDAWADSGETDTGKNFRKPFNVKAAERLKDKIEARLDALHNAKRDNLFTFEQLGVDDLTIDEAHEFKNLFFSSSLTDVRGLGNRLGSRKAADLYNKVRVLRESPTGTVTFLSGTPISNSAVEMFTIMRYLAADQLADLGLEHFDAWRAQFANIDTKWEPTESGRLKEVNRLGRTWSNMRSLMDTYYSFTDAVTNDDIKRVYAQENNGAEFPLPRVAGGGRQLVRVPATPAQVEFLQNIIHGFDHLPYITDPIERNKERLKLMDRARKVSLDVRAVDRSSTSTEEGGKLDVMAGTIAGIYKKWDADKGTQLVFLDRGVPKSKGDAAKIKAYDALVAEREAAVAANDEAAFQSVADRLEAYNADEMEELRAAQAGGWNAYQQLRDNLIARGIPGNEIRFIQSANNDAEKQALFDAVNAGDVRVLIGSTQRMGAGTNVQNKIVAVHHGDVTWKPSDIEQREGRGIRQGNSLLEKHGIDKFLLEIYAYATERSVEAKMWDLNATKLRMVNGIRKYDGSFSMDFDDSDSVSMAEMAALASGDPMLLQRVQTASEIESLELQEREHRRKINAYKDAIDSAKRSIDTLPARIASLLANAADVRERREALYAEQATRKITIQGKDYDNEFLASVAVRDEISKQQEGNDKARYEIEVNGKLLTSKESIENHITAALGDSAAFSMVINGKPIYSRTSAARVIATAIRERGMDLGEGEGAKVPVEASFLGLPVEVKVFRSSWGYYASMAVNDKNGKQISTRSTNYHDKIEKIETTVVRPLVTDIDSAVDAANMEMSAKWDKAAIQRAEAELPDLLEKVKTPFAKADELVAARRRLEEIISGLAGTQKPAPAPDAPKFDLGASGAGMAQAEVQTIVGAISAKWRSGPKVQVVQSVAELPFKAPAQARGAFWNGTVYLVADNLQTPSAAQFVLLHEAAGHFGLSAILGDQLDPLMRMIYDSNAKVREMADQRIAHAARLGRAYSPALATEEALADLAGRGEVANIRGWKLLLAKIRAALRQLGFTIEISDADIGALLKRAREALEAPSMVAAGARLSMPTGTFYSALQVGLKSAPFSKARTIQPAQLKSWIAARVKEGKFKAAEVEWSGINEWIDTWAAERPNQPISTIAVDFFMAEHGVKVDEVMLGEKSGRGRKKIEDDLRERGYLIQDDPGAMPGEPPWVFMEMHGQEAILQDPDNLDDNIVELVQEWMEAAGDAAEGPQFSKWQLPGGTNYRELLLTLPKRDMSVAEAKAFVDERFAAGGLERYEHERALRDPVNFVRENYHERERGPSRDFNAGHYEQPNVLAHVRFNERTDAEGRKVLFLEEIQSDWAQSGRKRGFGSTVAYTTIDRLGNQRGHFVTREAAQAFADFPPPELRDLMQGATVKETTDAGTPAAPFVADTKAWVALALKRMVRYAAEHGFDAVAWTNGQQQAERYSLERHVERIKSDAPDEDGMRTVFVKAKGASREIEMEVNAAGDIVRTGDYALRGRSLDAAIGKELAKRILESKRAERLEGLDLKVGGEGMHAFYDNIVPQVARDVMKKLGGGEVGTVTVDMAVRTSTGDLDGNDFYTREEDPSHKMKQQPGFVITPAMRDIALEGQPLFSLAGTPLGDGIEAVKDSLRNPRQFNWWHRTIGTQFHKAQAVPEFRPVFEAAQRYLQDVSQLAIDAADKAPSWLPRLAKFADVFQFGPPSKDLAAVSKVVFEGTLNATRPDAVALRNLTHAQRKLYTQARAAIDLSLDQTAVSELYKLAGDEGIDGAQKAAKDLPPRAALDLLQTALTMQAEDLMAAGKDRDAGRKGKLIDQMEKVVEKLDKLKGEGYAPLMRFGQYTVDVTHVEMSQAGKPVVVRDFFGMYESNHAAKKAERAMRAEFPQSTVTTGTMDDEGFKLYRGLSLDSLALFAEATGMKEHHLFQDYYKLAVSARSALTRLIHRKGVAGYNEDLQRVLASFITSNARMASRNFHFGEMTKAAVKIPTRMGDVRAEAAKLVDYVQNPVEEASKLRSLLFVNFLGGSVASALTNATQPVMMTLPYLSQFKGTAAAGKALAGSVSLAAGDVPRDPALRAAMSKAAKEGITEPQELHQLYAESIRGLGSSMAVRRGLRVWGSMFSIAESFNRRITFAAAFQLAQGMTPAELRKAGVDSPFAFAEKAVEDTQGIYNRGNRPNWARGPIGATVFTFKQYSIAYLEFLRRLPPKEKAIALSLLVLAAGLQGLPGADDLEDLIDTIGQMLGYNTNSKQAIREAAIDTLGKELGGLLMHGVSGLPGSPVDVQQRLGLSNLIPGSGMFLRSSPDKAREIAEVVGPIGGVYTQAANAAGAALAGQWGQVAAAATPVAVQNVLKGVDMAESGVYKDTRGRKVVDVSTTDAALKALGVQPKTVGEAQRIASDVQQSISMARTVEADIADKWARAIIAKDQAAVQKAVAELLAWNQNNPDWKIKITPAQIKLRVQAALLSRDVRLLKSAPAEVRQSVFTTLSGG